MMSRSLPYSTFNHTADSSGAAAHGITALSRKPKHESPASEQGFRLLLLNKGPDEFPNHVVRASHGPTMLGGKVAVYYCCQCRQGPQTIANHPACIKCGHRQAACCTIRYVAKNLNTSSEIAGQESHSDVEMSGLDFDDEGVDDANLSD
jgi:hypothetical protein